jgi:hypothetical protein
MKFYLASSSLRGRRFLKVTAMVASLLLGLTVFADQLKAQESSSKPSDTPASTTPATATDQPAPVSSAALPLNGAANSPAAALRDVLEAACSQDASGFSRLLTTRSKEAFERLTPAARVALMKRFVLLNVPGKASAATNPGGRPIVRCETPDVTTEMAIGGADVRDNLAFVPLELRDADDSTGVSVHDVSMGLVREGGQWRLLSLGLLLLDLPSLEVEWDSAEADANESTALENLKKLSEAVEAYRRTYFRLPESIANLGPPPKMASAKSTTEKTLAPTREHAGLVDAEFAAGGKDGYEFRIIISGAESLGAPAKYQLSATPATYGRTGKRSFFIDTDGGLHAGEHQGSPGSEADSKVN